jgi:CDGSH iron-sulfur domain-containing protein 3
MSDLNIQIKDNGPFLVQGDISIVDAEGKKFTAEGKAIALCRCGASTNQPFCTGNHRKIGFESAPRATK